MKFVEILDIIVSLVEIIGLLFLFSTYLSARWRANKESAKYVKLEKDTERIKRNIEEEFNINLSNDTQTPRANAPTD